MGERALHRRCAWRRREVLCDEASAHLRLLLRLTSEERDRLGVLSQPHERIAQIRLAQKLSGRLADERLPRRKRDPREGVGEGDDGREKHVSVQARWCDTFPIWMVEIVPKPAYAKIA